MEKTFKLSEKLFCLAINPAKGGVLMNSATALPMAITGAVLYELSKQDIISLKDNIVSLKSSNINSDEVFEFFLKHIRLKEKNRKIRYWISYFNNKSRTIHKMFVTGLVRRNILRVEEKRFLFIPYKKTYLSNRVIVESFAKEIEEFALGTKNYSDDIVILSILAQKLNLMSRIFPDRQKRKEAAKKLKSIPESDISKAVQEFMNSINTAVIIAAT